MSAAREAVLWLVENGDMSRTAEGAYIVSNNSSGKRKKGKSGAGMTAIVAAESESTGTGTDSGNGDAQVGGAGGAGERKEASFAARVNGTLYTPIRYSPSSAISALVPPFLPSPLTNSRRKRF